jgi:hypothetical protein
MHICFKNQTKKKSLFICGESHFATIVAHAMAAADSRAVLLSPIRTSGTTGSSSDGSGRTRRTRRECCWLRMHALRSPGDHACAATTDIHRVGRVPAHVLDLTKRDVLFVTCAADCHAHMRGEWLCE